MHAKRKATVLSQNRCLVNVSFLVFLFLYMVWLAYVPLGSEGLGAEFASAAVLGEAPPVPGVHAEARPNAAEAAVAVADTTDIEAPTVATTQSKRISAAVRAALQTKGGLATKQSSSLLVVLAAGMEQFNGTLVAINSAVRHAGSPSQLRFRIVTTSRDLEPLAEKLRAALPRNLDLKTFDFSPWLPRVLKFLGGKSSLRSELYTALNFAAFYLHEAFPKEERILYLDTDVVVLGDMPHELLFRKLDDQPAAGAQDCSQFLGKYVDLDRIKKKQVAKRLPLAVLAKKTTCVFNRGVVLINTARWAALNVTGTIEELVSAHLSKSAGPLWRSGVSQPPFLLALAGRYVDLGVQFNVRGLGRGDLSPEEISEFKKQKVWHSYFDRFQNRCKFKCCPGCKDFALSPFVSPLAHTAKVLHFNGRLKPDKVGNLSSAPLPEPKQPMDDATQKAWEQVPLCSCGDKCLKPCSSVWWEHLPPSS